MRIGGWILWLGFAPAAFGVADADLDFIVIDRDLFAIRPHEIGKTRVLCTSVDGRPVHEDRPGTICNGRKP